MLQPDPLFMIWRFWLLVSRAQGRKKRVCILPCQDRAPQYSSAYASLTPREGYPSKQLLQKRRHGSTLLCVINIRHFIFIEGVSILSNPLAIGRIFSRESVYESTDVVWEIEEDCEGMSRWKKNHDQEIVIVFWDLEFLKIISGSLV